MVSDELEGKQAALDYGNGSSPALKQREGVVNTTNVQAVHLLAPAERISCEKTPDQSVTGVDEVKQQLSREVEPVQPGTSGRKKLYRNKKRGSGKAAAPPTIESRSTDVKQPLISAFMREKEKAKNEAQGEGGSRSAQKPCNSIEEK